MLLSPQHEALELNPVSHQLTVGSLQSHHVPAWQLPPKGSSDLCPLDPKGHYVPKANEQSPGAQLQLLHAMGFDPSCQHGGDFRCQQPTEALVVTLPAVLREKKKELSLYNPIAGEVLFIFWSGCSCVCENLVRGITEIQRLYGKVKECKNSLGEKCKEMKRLRGYFGWMKALAVVSKIHQTRYQKRNLWKGGHDKMRAKIKVTPLYQANPSVRTAFKLFPVRITWYCLVPLVAPSLPGLRTHGLAAAAAHKGVTPWASGSCSALAASNVRSTSPGVLALHQMCKGQTKDMLY